jgi:DNA-binding GntR family transcriptional regulator
MEQRMQESVSVLPGLLDRSIRAHRAIYQAIRDRDRRKAVSSTKRHILDLQNSLEAYYNVTGKRRREPEKRLAASSVR